MSLDINISSILHQAINLGAWSNLTPVEIQVIPGGTTYPVDRMMYQQPTPEHPIGRIVLASKQEEPDQITPQESPQP